MIINNNFLIILTGLPASGKTLFAQTLKKNLEKKIISHTIEIIDPDIIRSSISHGKFDPTKEQIVREKNLEIVEKSLKKGNIVISDDLNYYTSMRHDLKKVADDLQIAFYIVYISTPFEICLKWNQKRGKPIPNVVIKRVSERFDDFNKYYWDNPIARYDLSRVKNLEKHIDELGDNIILSNISRKSPKENKFERNKKNFYRENLDKITRIVVRDLLRDNKNIPLKKKIIKLRKRFIKENINKMKSESEVSKSFILFLEKNLNFKFS